MQPFDEPFDACNWAEQRPAIVGNVFTADTREGYITVYRKPGTNQFDWSFGFDERILQLT